MIDLTISPELIKREIMKLPFEEQDIEIAKWFMSKECQEDMRERPLPSKPRKVIEYYGFSADVRKEMNKRPEDYKSFWHDPIVKDYFDQANKVKEINQRNRDWDNWARKILAVKEADIEWTD